MTQEVPLLPCPFCGGKPRKFQTKAGRWIIECTVCGIETLKFRQEDEQGVDYCWNRRPLPVAQGVDREADAFTAGWYASEGYHSETHENGLEESLDIFFKDAGRFDAPKDQEKALLDFKDAVDSELFGILDDCRRACTQGCHTVGDDRAWEQCEDHQFLTDQIDKLRKKKWPEVQAAYISLSESLEKLDAPKDERDRRH